MPSNNTDPRPLIFSKMAEIMKNVDPIAKGRRNQEQGFMYRGIDDIFNELHTAFATAGVFITTEILTSSREARSSASGKPMVLSIIDYRFRFFAEDGSYIETQQRGEAMDLSDKASNKCASIAMKYALMQILMIPTQEDKDPDAHSPAPAAVKNGTPAKPASPSPTEEQQQRIDEWTAKIQGTPLEIAALNKLLGEITAIPTDAIKLPLKAILSKHLGGKFHWSADNNTFVEGPAPAKTPAGK